ncbi:threonyl-tRNA synthetase editing domain-containing protein [Haloarchaeobius sp. TZWWS8]|uniref:threonyl-tRNA synthetase editing domain-containing protein n=1 Tax=Haloarchaeobius sp. TZWWS8 TaxID=3446121 RepID=UPI003EBA99C0
MRLLCSHAEHFGFEASEAIAPDAEEDRPTEGSADGCVAAFVTFEPGDGRDVDRLVANGAAELRELAGRLNADPVVLYPFGDLRDDRTDTAVARELLDGLHSALDDELTVLRAPLGWNTSFDLRCKGHPFAERVLSVSHERRADRSDETDWFRVTEAGQRSVMGEEWVEDQRDDLVRAVTAGEYSETGALWSTVRESGGMRESVQFVAGDGRGDDVGISFLPAGRLVRETLRRFLEERVLDAGAVPVEADDGGRSPADTVGYAGGGDDARTARLFETGTGTPTIHARCPNRAAARDEFVDLSALAASLLRDLDFDPLPVVTLSASRFDAEADWLSGLAATIDQPLLVGAQPDSAREKGVGLDLVVDDGASRPVELARLELPDVDDVEAAAVDTASEPVTVSCAPVGDLDHCVVAALARAQADSRRSLPTWLAPTQVRLVPIGDRHVDKAETLASRFESAGLRADVDDRTDEPVGTRLSAAADGLVPYTAVVGDREADAERLKVTSRSDGRERLLSPGELESVVERECSGRPSVRRYLPRRLSVWPVFGDG